MASSISSEGLALQPYFDDTVSTTPSGLTSRNSSLIHPLARGKYDDVELRIVRYIGWHRIPVANVEEIRATSTSDASAICRSGLTMLVRSMYWDNQEVAVKRIRRKHYDQGNETSRLLAEEEYKRSMYDMLFELQIMSRPALRRHRNIVKLLAIAFDSEPTQDVDQETALVSPILIVELADRRFPDLGLYMDPEHNRERPARLPFEVGASLISDIADGVEALHRNRIVHGDLKPGNILIFLDDQAPSGLVAKISDFGVSGMGAIVRGQEVSYTAEHTRGGTLEWMAPECFLEASPPNRYSRDFESDKPSRDVYSFGLLAAYIALDGQSPKSYVNDLTRMKIEDKILDMVIARIKNHYGEANERSSLGNFVNEIVEMTLPLQPTRRTRTLNTVRTLLYGSDCQVFRLPEDQPVVGHRSGPYNLFPDTQHDMVCEGFYNAYWKSPPAIRKRVYEAFRQQASGVLAQATNKMVWTWLKDPNYEFDHPLGCRLHALWQA